MTFQRSQAPTLSPAQATDTPEHAPAASPLLALQGLIGNAGLLELLRAQMPGGAHERAPSPGAAAAPAQAPAPDAPTWWDEAVDGTVGGVGSLVDRGASLVFDVPVLGAAAEIQASATTLAWETLGGAAKGAGDLVGGLADMVVHPLDTLQGIGTMLEHIPGSPLKVLHKLSDVATGDKTLDETFLRDPLDVAAEDLDQDFAFWKQIGGALLDPYARSLAQGKTGEAFGRALFDLSTVFVGAGKLKALGKTGETLSALNKTDDAVKVASTSNALLGKGDDLARAGNKADDATKFAGQADHEGMRLVPSKDKPAKLTSPTDDPAAPPSPERLPPHPSDLVDLATPDRRTHILDGDTTGGGHRAGTGAPGKSEFPARWSDDQVMHHVSDIVTDPAATPGPNNSARLYDRLGRPIRRTYTGVRDGVQVQVVYEPATGRIVSAYPTGLADPATGQILPYPSNPP